MLMEMRAVFPFGEGGILIRWDHRDSVRCYYCPVLDLCISYTVCLPCKN